MFAGAGAPPPTRDGDRGVSTGAAARSWSAVQRGPAATGLPGAGRSGLSASRDPGPGAAVDPTIPASRSRPPLLLHPEQRAPIGDAGKDLRPLTRAPCRALLDPAACFDVPKKPAENPNKRSTTRTRRLTGAAPSGMTSYNQTTILNNLTVLRVEHGDALWDLLVHSLSARVRRALDSLSAAHLDIGPAGWQGVMAALSGLALIPSVAPADDCCEECGEACGACCEDIC